jgi:serpin B
MYTRITRYLALALALSVVLAGCAPPSSGVVQAAALASSKPRLSPAQADATGVANLVQGNTRFALDLYHALSSTKDNLFSSPYSISLALAMVYAGARGDTEAEMARTLHFPAREVLQPAFNALDQALRSRGQNVKEGERFRLNIANATWGQKGLAFQSEFLDALAQYYGSGLRIVDFKQAAEAARQTINQWVEDQTEKKIKDLLPPGSLDAMTRLVLTNTIYFNAAWANPFDPQATQDGAFHLLDGGQVTVPMMRQSASLGYASGNGYQAVELPYAGGEMAMDIILPDAGSFAGWAQGLDAAALTTILNGIEFTQVELAMPRFRFESGVELKEALQELGMPQAFTTAADFSGMTGRPELFINNVYHKAFVAVDEKGTEAAAATAAVMNLTAMPAQPVEVTVERPFVFVIRDIASGTVLFLGHVVNPGQ